jgi:N-acyl homoserine lactone hydrolase
MKLKNEKSQEGIGTISIQSKKETSLSLKPIPTGKAAGPKRMLFYQSRSDEIMYGAQYAWLVLGSQKNILIDCAGLMAVERLSSLGIEAEVLGNLIESLKEEGLSPKDIDIIIATHLHADHIVSAKDFPRARIVVQKKELIGALNPCPVLKFGYPQEVIKPLFEANRFDLVDGDVEIEPGLKVMLTPGHTAGGQSVILQAGDKKVIVTGFCSFLENFFPSDPSIDCIPLGMYEEIVPAYESLVKVKQMADIVVPIHEPKFLKVERIP